MDGWIPVSRYRGQLVRSKCPFCDFLIGSLCHEDERDASWAGRLVSCIHCRTVFREGLEWA